MPISKHTRYLHYTPNRHTKIGLIVAAVACFGLLALQISQAATETVSGEAEDGTVTNAALVDDASASGGKLVRFGDGGGALSAPTELIAFAGGAGSVLRWTASTSPNVDHYNIYRDGAKVGEAMPDPNTVVDAYKAGTRFIDPDLPLNATYKYTVQAADAAGGVSPFSAEVQAVMPATTTPVPTVTVDASKAADLKTWVETKVIPELKVWYPKFGDLFAKPEITSPSTITVNFDPAMPATSYSTVKGTTITLNPNYYKAHQNDVDDVLYNSTFFHLGYETTTVPFWFPQAVAQYAIFDLYGNVPALAKPSTPAAYYSDSGRTGAYFLKWLHAKDPTFIHKLAAAGASKTMTAQHLTINNKNLDELWAEMMGKTATSGTFGLKGNNLCIDVPGSPIVNNIKTQLATCNAATASQKITSASNGDGTVTLHVLGRCLRSAPTVSNVGGTVNYGDCSTADAGQKWKINNTTGAINHPSTNRCLSVTNAAVSVAAGSGVETWTCSDVPYQKWTIPSGSPTQ